MTDDPSLMGTTADDLQGSEHLIDLLAQKDGKTYNGMMKNSLSVCLFRRHV